MNEEMNEEMGLESRAELVQIYKEGTTIKELRAARDACRTGGKVCMYNRWMNGYIMQGIALGLICCLKANIILYRQCCFTPSRTQHSHSQPLQPYIYPPIPEILGSAKQAPRESRRRVRAAADYHYPLFSASKQYH